MPGTFLVLATLFAAIATLGAQVPARVANTSLQMPPEMFSSLAR